MSAEEIRETITNDYPFVVEAYGTTYAAGWRAALEWMARKGEQK